MSGQVDIGWAAPPFGLQEIKEGKIRIVARGSDVPSLRGQTVRTLIVNANSLKTKRDAIMRFMDAYRESVDWMYSDPKAVEMYSEKINRPVDLLKNRWPNSSRRKRCRPTSLPILMAPSVTR